MTEIIEIIQCVVGFSIIGIFIYTRLINNSVSKPKYEDLHGKKSRKVRIHHWDIRPPLR